jgi:hypothetical protein
MQIRERRRDIAMHSVAIKFKKKIGKFLNFNGGGSETRHIENATAVLTALND